MNIFLKNIQFALLSLEQPRTQVSQWILEAQRSQISGFWTFCAPKMAQKSQIVGHQPVHQKKSKIAKMHMARSILAKKSPFGGQFSTKLKMS